jgi:23S rRNA pseudouridine2605 synthase
LVLLGRVTLNGRICRNAEQPASLEADEVAVDGERIEPARRVYILLNKPRGLVTTSADERGRETVFACLIMERAAESAAGAPELFHRKKAARIEFRLPGHLSAVGRLDQASEGLLLFTNDNGWAERLTSPQHHLDKVYHVQINAAVDEALCHRLETGAQSEGELLRAKKATVLRRGGTNSWLEITLDEGRNRHIRRLLAVCGLEVLRLIRVSVGTLKLGSLGKGQWRHLTPREVQAFFPEEIPAPAEAQAGPDGPAAVSERAPWKRPAKRR